MKIQVDEITSVIKEEIAQYTEELEVSEVGRVIVIDSKSREQRLGSFEMRVGRVSCDASTPVHLGYFRGVVGGSICRFRLVR